jgi:hypothetical protein
LAEIDFHATKLRRVADAERCFSGKRRRSSGNIWPNIAISPRRQGLTDAAFLGDCDIVLCARGRFVLQNSRGY